MQECGPSVDVHGVVSGSVGKAGSRRLQRRLQLTSGLILAALLLIAAPANAASLADWNIGAVWFPTGGDNTGVGPSGWAGADVHPANSSYRFLCAGEGDFDPASAALSSPLACSDPGRTEYDLLLSRQLVGALQFPQLDGEEPWLENPLIAEVSITVFNNTAEALDDLLLAFTRVILPDFAGSLAPGDYPDLINDDPMALSSTDPASGVGLDLAFVDIIEYESGGSYSYYPGVKLDLAAYEEVSFLVQYLVQHTQASGPMPRVEIGGYETVILPPLGVVGAVVPEPSTALLLGSGLLGLAVAGRRYP